MIYAILVGYLVRSTGFATMVEFSILPSISAWSGVVELADEPSNAIAIGLSLPIDSPLTGGMVDQ